MSVKITCFHTCHLQGSQKEILAKVPFHSELNKEQWLDQGYYFWTDSDFYAHKWGNLQVTDENGTRKFKYPNGYAITKFTIVMPAIELLDLVGNTDQQIFFVEMIKKYLENIGESISREEICATPVSKVIAHLRLQVSKYSFDYFPYAAVKACDKPKDSNQLHFLDIGNEAMILPTRQQICLFTEFSSYIQERTIHKLVPNAQRNFRTRR